MLTARGFRIESLQWLKEPDLMQPPGVRFWAPSVTGTLCGAVRLAYLFTLICCRALLLNFCIRAGS